MDDKKIIEDFAQLFDELAKLLTQETSVQNDINVAKLLATEGGSAQERAKKLFQLFKMLTEKRKRDRNSKRVALDHNVVAALDKEELKRKLAAAEKRIEDLEKQVKTQPTPPFGIPAQEKKS